LSKDLSRKQKAKSKLAKLLAWISHIRKDGLYKLTSDLTCRFDTIAIEDLNVSGMMSNRHLARAIADMGFYEFRRQLEYKALMRGGIVIVADRWFASSKLCSFCAKKNTSLILSMRQWRCGQCVTFLKKITHCRIYFNSPYENLFLSHMMPIIIEIFKLNQIPKP
jgi:putative transposase